MAHFKSILFPPDWMSKHQKSLNKQALTFYRRYHNILVLVIFHLGVYKILYYIVCSNIIRYHLNIYRKKRLTRMKNIFLQDFTAENTLGWKSIDVNITTRHLNCWENIRLSYRNISGTKKI